MTTAQVPATPQGGRTSTAIRTASTRVVLPEPPDDDEKYAYVQRNLPYLTITLVISATCLTISQIRFEAHNPALWPFMVFTATYVLYQVIGLPVNFTGRGFDLAAHQARIRSWHPHCYPGVDIFLPICGEPIEVLNNTWTAVTRLLASYPGTAQAYVLDDGPSDEAQVLAESIGFRYIRRPGFRVHKKAGNLRYAFAQTSSEFIVILDSDFAPRHDFLAETLPYMDDPTVAIVQSPQYFRQSPEQSWIENAAGAIQEVFYRSIQVARNRFGAAICVGTSAVYRRVALEPQGGPTLIPYAEDVHTGLDVRMAGWSIVYMPVLLSTGICPDNLDAFVRQQYRWCTGNAGIVFSHRLWQTRMSIPARLTFLSGFFYYAYTGLLNFVGPLIPVVMLAFLPGRRQAAELRHPAACAVRRLCAVRAVASFQLRAVGLAAGHRPRVGARVRALGRRPAEDDELAADPHAGWFAAPLPDRGHLVERGHGYALGDFGYLADGVAGFRTVRGRAGLRGAQPRRCEPRYLSRKEVRMKYRLVTLIAFLVAVTAIAVTTHQLSLTTTKPPTVHATAQAKIALLSGRLRGWCTTGLPAGDPICKNGHPEA